MKSISVFQRAARKAELVAADQAAQREIERQRLNHEHERAQYQAQLDQWWAALVNNAENVVLDVLAEAFEDNEHLRPSTTPAGDLTLKKLTKAERGGPHTTLVASHVLLTVRETLAVVPGITGVRVAALQHSRNDAFGQPRVDSMGSRGGRHHRR